MELVSRLKKSFVERNEQYSDLERRIEELRESALEAERGREKSEQQMEFIKTQREYEALDKEIKSASQREQDLRRELQRESARFDEMKETISREELLIKKQEEEIQGEKSRINDQLKDKEKALKNLKKKESSITPGLDEELIFKFERIIRSKSGLGIVPVVDGVCTGCHMVLPFHFVNVIRQGEGIRFCPDCSRILFYEDLPNEDEELSDELLDDVDEAFLEDDALAVAVGVGLADADEDEDESAEADEDEE